MSDVRIAGDGVELPGKLLLPHDGGARHPAILFIHGWGASQRQDVGKAKRLVRLGYACLTFNLQGHGRTRRAIESITRADNLADAVAAYDFLASADAVDADSVGVVASSYGAYLAVLLTVERSLRWLALQAPALYKDDDFDRPKRELNRDPQLSEYRRQTLTPDANRALQGAARFRGAVLIVEAEKDIVIPHQVVANYLTAFEGAATLSHEVILAADHGLSAERWRREYGRILVDWFRTRPRPKVPPGRASGVGSVRR
jgi:pimeloyl-ACP methyl ester carboxylesterase